MDFHKTEFKENSEHLTQVAADYESLERSAEAEKARETERNDLLGQESGSVDGRIDVGQKASKARDGQVGAEKEKRSKQFNDAAFMTLLDSIRRDIERLEKEMEEKGKRLREKYGDNYVEILAGQYLDEDTATRRRGETDKAYERRVAKEIGERARKGEIDVADPLILGWTRTAEKLDLKIQEEAAEMNRQAKAALEDGQLNADEQEAVSRRAEEAKAVTTNEAELQEEDITLVRTWQESTTVKTEDIGKDLNGLSGWGALEAFSENAADITVAGNTPGTPIPSVKPDIVLPV